MLWRSDEALLCNGGRAGFSVGLTVGPVTDESDDLLGKNCSDLQENIRVSADGTFTGTLHYVTGYTGFSGDPTEQEGNYLAIKVTGDADRVRVKSTKRGANWITLDASREHIWILKNGTQGGFIVEEKIGDKITTNEYNFSGLTLEPATNNG
ncbi:MAG: hypothetical protein J6U54_15870 [Clostridiales bacterium]|nr:hypothetical protein [Clostridiales bacterium]